MSCIYEISYTFLKDLLIELCLIALAADNSTEGIYYILIPPILKKSPSQRGPSFVLNCSNNHRNHDECKISRRFSLHKTDSILQLIQTDHRSIANNGQTFNTMKLNPIQLK